MDISQTKSLRTEIERGASAAAPPADTSPRWLGVLSGGRLFPPLAVLLATLLAMLGATVFYSTGYLEAAQLIALESFLTLLGVAMIGVCMHRMEHNLLAPLARLRQWATRMRGGDLTVSVPVPYEGEFAPLATDLRCLCEEFKRLKADLDSQVAKQTERLAQKNASLNILYDVAARINEAENSNELLLRFLRTLKEMVGAQAATVHVANDAGGMRVLAGIGIDDLLVSGTDLLPVPLCMCGRALPAGNILCELGGGLPCAGQVGHPMRGPNEIETVQVPLEHQGRILGLFDLYVSKPGVSGREDILDLLTSVGSHLGMALEKARLGQESRHISIMEERNAIANELHDSLAQTLASLGFQVQVLADVLTNEGPDEARNRLGQVRNSLDEAHTELRELITQFRAPLDDCGLVPAIEKLVERFRRDSDISVFLQCPHRVPDLPAETRLQVLRIVQESLANVRKHSGARLVRVLLRGTGEGGCMVLVEDNGQGFRTGEIRGSPGEHIGLSIMEERAQRIGGDLRIESEPGEGARVELTFRCPSAAACS